MDTSLVLLLALLVWTFFSTMEHFIGQFFHLPLLLKYPVGDYCLPFQKSYRETPEQCINRCPEQLSLSHGKPKLTNPSG